MFSAVDVAVTSVTYAFGGTTGKSVRSIPSPTNLNVTVTSLEGLGFTSAEEGYSNFVFDVFLSDSVNSNTVVVLDNVYSHYIYKETNRTGLAEGEEKTFVLQFDTAITANECWGVEYICVNASAGNRSEYSDTNSTNNMFCAQIEQTDILCNPGEVKCILNFTHYRQD